MKKLDLEPYFLRSNKKIENTEAYLGPYSISTMELVSEIVDGF